MPIISAKIIKKPTKLRFCEGMQLHAFIPKGESCIRIYGSAFRSDKPYVMYMCMNCAEESSDNKVIEALSGYKNDNN